MKRTVQLLTGVLLLLLPVIAEAGPEVMCTFVPGGCAPTNIAAENTIPVIATLLLRAAAGLGVIFMIWAGYMMLFNLGDESKVTTARYSILYAFIGLGLAAGSQMIVYFFVSEHVEAQISAGNWDLQIYKMAARILLNMFNGLFAIVLVLAAIRMITSEGKPDDYNKGKTMAKWAIGGAVIVNVSNAAVQTALSIFGV